MTGKKVIALGVLAALLGAAIGAGVVFVRRPEPGQLIGMHVSEVEAWLGPPFDEGSSQGRMYALYSLCPPDDVLRWMLLRYDEELRVAGYEVGHDVIWHVPFLIDPDAPGRPSINPGEDLSEEP